MRRRALLKQIALASAGLPLARLVPHACAEKPPKPAPVQAFLNQLGYLPHAAKAASIAMPQDHAGMQLEPRFHLRSLSTQQVVFTGRLAYPALDAASGDLVMQAGFTAFDQPGRYRVELAGADGLQLASDAFEIRPDIYADALRVVMRSYYGQRCGCAVDLGQGYAHPACHLDGAYHASSGRKGTIGNHGGWHDAGDYGRYVVNSAITCGTLLWAWEMYPKQLHTLKLQIPESGGRVPDYLAEVRWNLQWMLAMQDDDGGVWHKQTSEQFCPFVMPQDDHTTSYIIGTGAAPYKSTGATAGLAAVMAIAARCYGPHDDTFARRCLAAAERAFAWTAKHPDVRFENPPGIGTGGYEDAGLRDDRLWAAAELFRATGKPVYEHAFLAGLAAMGTSYKLTEPGWGDVTSLACWTYAMTSHATDRAAAKQIRESTRQAALLLLERGRANGYGNTLQASDYGWGSNSVAANQSLFLLMANHFHADSKMLDGAFGNLHYLLGRNCLGVSWVTQVGIRPFQHPHHRPSAADGIAAPWPGLLSGGPNRHPGDGVGEKLPKLPPMRMWADDQAAYSLNEIAINWNAPLVFLLAAANSPGA